jgi:ABC-2 type transport system permease protein
VIRLVNAELIKIRTTQVWFWLLLAAIALSALVVIGAFASGDVHNGSDVAHVFAAAASAYIVLFVLGVLGVTTEFRYKTITSTVLVTPSRWTLITAKLIAYAILGALYALVCLVIQLAVAIPWIAVNGTDIDWGSSGIPRALWGVFVVLALFGIVGLGIGALLKNQIVAVTVGVIFLLILQGIISVIPGLRVIYPYLPGGAVDAILPTGNSVPHVDILSTAGGVVVLLLWAFIPALIGASLTMNRDIT